ncbi:hypothetical protein C8R46DRAFT_1282807 [Mycena filopes]|nr:hypothetical protein C8R46DRAFT_1222346 [Mycena filopes]KAJ7162209.1 hypothetical protein C8R46DRAFT_1282807 [Mycena filopes]
METTSSTATATTTHEDEGMGDGAGVRSLLTARAVATNVAAIAADEDLASNPTKGSLDSDVFSPTHPTPTLPMPIEHSNFAAPLNGQTNHALATAFAMYQPPPTACSWSDLGLLFSELCAPAIRDAPAIPTHYPSKLQHTSTESNLKRTGFQRSPGLSTTLETQNYESFVELQASSTPLDSAEDQHRIHFKPFKLEALNAEFLLGLVGLSQGITHLKLDNLLQVLDGETLLELNKGFDFKSILDVVQIHSVCRDYARWTESFNVQLQSTNHRGRAGVGLSMDLSSRPTIPGVTFSFEPNPLRANKSDFNAHLQVARKRITKILLALTRAKEHLKASIRFIYLDSDSMVPV